MKDPLDALLDEAMALSARRRTLAVPSKAEARLRQIQESFHELYLNPENWTRTCGIALVHISAKDEKTLLGNFSEYVHRKNPSARKLVRESSPMEVSKTEFVKGDWWVKEHLIQHAALPKHQEIRSLKIDLELAELQVYAKGVQVRVHLQQGWIRRVELSNLTQFICPTNKIFLYFPEGVDVLEGMSMENKMELKGMLGV